MRPNDAVNGNFQRQGDQERQGRRQQGYQQNRPYVQAIRPYFKEQPTVKLKTVVFLFVCHEWHPNARRCEGLRRRRCRNHAGCMSLEKSTRDSGWPKPPMRYQALPQRKGKRIKPEEEAPTVNT